MTSYQFSSQEFNLSDSFFRTVTLKEVETHLIQNKSLPNNWVSLKITSPYNEAAEVYIPNINFYVMSQQRTRLLNAIYEDLDIPMENRQTNKKVRCIPTNNQITWKLLKKLGIVRNPTHVKDATSIEFTKFRTLFLAKSNRFSQLHLQYPFGWNIFSKSSSSNQDLSDPETELPTVFLPFSVMEKRRLPRLKLLESLMYDLKISKFIGGNNKNNTSPNRFNHFSVLKPKDRKLQKLNQTFSSDLERMKRGKSSQIRTTLCRSRAPSIHLMLSVCDRLDVDEICINQRIKKIMFGETNHHYVQPIVLLARFPITQSTQVVAMRVRCWEEFGKENVLTCGIPPAIMHIENADCDGDMIILYVVKDIRCIAESQLLNPKIYPVACNEFTIHPTHDLILYFYMRYNRLDLKHCLKQLFIYLTLTNKPLSILSIWYQRLFSESIQYMNYLPAFNPYHLLQPKPDILLSSFLDSKATRMNRNAFCQITQQPMGEVYVNGCSTGSFASDELKEKIFLPHSFCEGNGLFQRELISNASLCRGAVVTSKTGLMKIGNSQPNLQFNTCDLLVSYRNTVVDNRQRFVCANPWLLLLTLEPLPVNSISFIFEEK